MKIIAISDIHGDIVENLPKGDVLVIAGDILPDDYRPENRDMVGTTRIIRQMWWFDDVLLPWMTGLIDSKTFQDIVFIGGNHDFAFQSLMPSTILKILEGHPHIHYLCEYGVEIDGVKFWGAPWNCTAGWAFFTEEEAYEEKLCLVPPDTDVFITHGPPYHPIVRPMFHYTSHALGRWVEQQKNLKALICGHIHEAYGFYKLFNTPTYVVCSKDRHYRLVNAPVEIEIE